MITGCSYSNEAGRYRLEGSIYVILKILMLLINTEKSSKPDK